MKENRGKGKERGLELKGISGEKEKEVRQRKMYKLETRNYSQTFHFKKERQQGYKPINWTVSWPGINTTYD